MGRLIAEESNGSAWREELQALEDGGRSAFLARDLARLDELWSDGRSS